LEQTSKICSQIVLGTDLGAAQGHPEAIRQGSLKDLIANLVTQI
jgi:hypothetical protein